MHERPSERPKIEDIHAWMLDYPELTEACAAWLTASATLRQRDYRLLKWGRNRITAHKKHEQSLLSMQVHPMHGWTERSKSLVSAFQAIHPAGPIPLNITMDAHRSSKIEALGRQLMEAKYPNAISLPAWKGRYLNTLLKSETTTPIATYANFAGSLQTISTVGMLLAGVAYVAFILSFMFLAPVDPLLHSQHQKTTAFILSTIFITLLILFSLSLRWMMGDAPLSALGTNRMRELSVKHPDVAAFFFSRIPKDHYLSYRHYKIFCKMVYIVRDYIKVQAIEQQSSHMRSAIENLPAAKKSIANAQAKTLDINTHSTDASVSPRRL